MLYFHWANDPTVRTHSFTQEPIPLDTHQRWFERALADPYTVLYVAETEPPYAAPHATRQPIGQIRFHCADGIAEIGFSLDAAFRGKGLGTALLRAGSERLVQEYSKRFTLRTVRGAVKITNTASHLAFERAGFVRSADSTDAVIYYEQHIAQNSHLV
jgi:RimJ/RimL family protein N-acetyltransferase